MSPAKLLSKANSKIDWLAWRRTRIWRLIGTALAFGSFGAGAGLFSLSIFPTLYFLPISKKIKQPITRKLIGWTFKHYLWELKLLGLISYEAHSMDKLKASPQLIISNHPSLLDVVFLIGFIGNTNCVVKASLWRNPFTALAVRAAGYIRNDDQALFELCTQCLRSGDSLIVFPEGTRSKPGQPLKFYRGPANIALCTGLPVTPITIVCEPVTLLKHQKWYQIPERPSHFTFTARTPIESQPFLQHGEPQCTAARKLTRHLLEFYNQALGATAN